MSSYLPCIVAHDEAAEVEIEGDSLMITSGNMVQLIWSPERVLPLVSLETYNVDISVWEFNDISLGRTVTEIVTGVANTGFIEVTIPEFSSSGSVEDSIRPAVIQISVNVMTSETQGGILPDTTIQVLEAVGIFTRVILLVKSPISELMLRSACNEWGLTQSRNEALETLASLPPCPCTVAAVSGGEFEEDFSSATLHPNRDRCFQERKRLFYHHYNQ